MAADAIKGGAGDAIPHDSAVLHVQGRASYTDDLPEPRDLLHLAVGMSEHAHARIRSIDLAAVRQYPGVVEVITAEDIRGKNNCGPVVDDDPLLAPGLVEYAGQAVFAVAADTVESARRAAREARIEYEVLEPILDIRAAVAAESLVLPTERIERGDSRVAIDSAPAPDSAFAVARRPGPVLPGRAGRHGAAARGRRSACLQFDTASRRSAAAGRRGHWQTGQGRRCGVSPYGWRFRRQGKPGQH